MNLAGLFTAVGDYDQALRLLQEAYENREGSMVRVKVDSAFDDLHSDPRFLELLRRMRPEP